MEANPKARRGHARNHRPDRVPLVIALVMTPDGFPLAYEVMDDNTTEHRTLVPFLERIEKSYGKAKRVWVMDRGIPSEETLGLLREPERETFYLASTPKGQTGQDEQKWLDLPWRQVRDSAEGKLHKHEVELYVLARNQGRQDKENATRRKRLVLLLKKLRAMRRSLPARDQLLLRIGAAQKEADRAFSLVDITLPRAQQEVTRDSFRFKLNKEKLRQIEDRNGEHLKHSDLTAEDPELLWTRFEQLTQIESVFRSLKSEMGIRPIYHRLEHRVDAHILVAFLAYCLHVTLKNRLQIHAPGLTPKAMLEKLSAVQMIDVWIPTVDGRWLMLPRYTQPEKSLQVLLDNIHLALPSQPDRKSVV